MHRTKQSQLTLKDRNLIQSDHLKPDEQFPIVPMQMNECVQPKK